MSDRQRHKAKHRRSRSRSRSRSPPTHRRRRSRSRSKSPPSHRRRDEYRSYKSFSSREDDRNLSSTRRDYRQRDDERKSTRRICLEDLYREETLCSRSPSAKPTELLIAEQLKELEPTLLFTGEAFFEEKLMKVKKNLNDTKSKLDNKDLRLWGDHTNFTNLTRKIPQDLRFQIKGEMFTIAWAKMYQMIAQHNLISLCPTHETEMHTVHLCEAPGAFICATNHYLRTTHPTLDWSWTGYSLNPYNSGNSDRALISDDKFICETPDNWYYGVDGTGDIMNASNIRGLWNRVKSFPPVMLVTADGSIDCQDNPNEQEVIVAPIMYCEIVAALGVLHVGGSFLIKYFTLLEHTSLSALYLLGTLFETVHVSKPVCSKAGNSEVYIIARNFGGISIHLRDALLNYTGPTLPSNSLVPHSLMQGAFLSRAMEIGTKFAEWQRHTIEENISLFDDMPHTRKEEIQEAHRNLTRDFISKFKVTSLAEHQKIVPSKFLSGAGSSTGRNVRGAYRRPLEGSLNERRSQYDVPAIASISEDRLSGDKSAKSGTSAETESVTTIESTSRQLTFAERQMAAMGYIQGRGLGKDQQGVAFAPPVVHRGDRAGIGFGAPSTVKHEQITARASPASWLETLSPIEFVVCPSNRLPPKRCDWDVAKYSNTNVAWVEPGIADRLGALLRQADDLKSVDGELFQIALNKAVPSAKVERFKHRISLNLLSVYTVSSVFDCIVQSGESSGSVILDLSTHGTANEFLISKFPGVRILSPVKNTEQDSARQDSDQSSFTSVLNELQDPVLYLRSLETAPVEKISLAVIETPLQDDSESLGGDIDRLMKRIWVALKSLSQGGSLVIGIRSAFRPFGISVFYILYRTFVKVSICKPFSSDPLSDECFLVAEGYQIAPDEILSLLRERILSQSLSHHDFFVPFHLLNEQHFFTSCVRLLNQIQSIRANAVETIIAYHADKDLPHANSCPVTANSTSTCGEYANRLLDITPSPSAPSHETDGDT